MLVADLGYLEPLCQPNCVTGSAYAYAEADAKASNKLASANSLAIAKGDYTAVRTETSVTFSSGEHVNYSLASASSFAFAQTGYKYSVAVDYAADVDASRRY